MDFKTAGHIAWKHGELEQAARCYDAAIAGNTRDWESIAALASIRLDENRTGEAFTLFQQALSIEMDAKVLADMGRVLTVWGEYGTALTFFQKAHEVDPKNVAAMNNAAMACTQLGQPDLAADWLTKARSNLTLEEQWNENYSDVDRNWAQIHLIRQDWEKGWEAYELGMGKGERVEQHYPRELLVWSPLIGKKERVVVYGEQGLGDEILFASCIPDLMKQCDDVIIECMPRLVGVFSRSFPEARVYGSRYNEHKHWFHDEEPTCKTSMGQLPRWFRKSNEDFPGTPYIKPNPEMAAMVRGLFSELPRKKKVGIAWNGGTLKTGWQSRQVPVDAMMAAFSDIDAEFISLQHTLGEDERPEDFGCHVFPQITHRELDYEWTCALLSELDAVVSVPTAVLHAAGAVGTPTLVMLNDHPQWRCGGPTMPWWDSVEVMKGWTLDSVAERLREVLNEPR